MTAPTDPLPPVDTTRLVVATMWNGPQIIGRLRVGMDPTPEQLDALATAWTVGCRGRTGGCGSTTTCRTRHPSRGNPMTNVGVAPAERDP